MRGVKRMRLDKFLKVARIIKRRTLAKEVADKGRIQINDKVAKSSSNISIGVQITIQFGNKILKIKVEEIRDTTKKEDAQKMYTVLAETKVDSTDKLH